MLKVGKGKVWGCFVRILFIVVGLEDGRKLKVM